MTDLKSRWIDGSSTATAKIFFTLLADESAQDLIEYGLIMAFIAVASIATMKGLATNLGTFFGSLGTTLTSAV